ncbi:hypothetical protein NMY22_g14969 [Coprinellus aureogranulatus]|nr:hypothetical protein NMY22_g14969 [Coprinellus aureogranulatus]
MSSPNPYPYGYETWGEKFSRKFKENPWVPAVRMRQGKSQSMNHWMRARVGLQGLTLVALVSGSMAIKKQREENAALEASVDDLVLALASTTTSQTEKDSLLAKAESKVLSLLAERQKKERAEKVEFELRMQEAEQAHRDEEGLLSGQKVVKGPNVVRHDNAIPGKQGVEAAPQVNAATTVGSELDPSKKSWWKVW